MGISAEILQICYRLSLEFQLISITDTDFGLKTNQFYNHFGYNGGTHVSSVGFDFYELLAALWIPQKSYCPIKAGQRVSDAVTKSLVV